MKKKILNAIKNFPYPTIAMLNGHAFGAGFNLCACCDIRIAADSIRMGMTPASNCLIKYTNNINSNLDNVFAMSISCHKNNTMKWAIKNCL